MSKQTDDITLVKSILSGNTAAFGLLVKKHADMVFTIVHKVVQNREDAEEVAQDVFVKAYQSLQTFKGTAKFSTWLYRIAYNMAISHTRKQKHIHVELEEKMAQEMTEDEIIENLDTFDYDMRSEMVEQAINKLPNDENMIVTLFYLEDNTVEDISCIMGISKENVKIKLFRIRKKLYAQLQQSMYQYSMV